MMCSETTNGAPVPENWTVLTPPNPLRVMNLPFPMDPSTGPNPTTPRHPIHTTPRVCDRARYTCLFTTCPARATHPRPKSLINDCPIILTDTDAVADVGVGVDVDARTNWAADEAPFGIIP
ncbi:hypothetical protein Pelo_17711 [Pelomyxa schiedti]|nr:hypothetical protein Pelo_17711 [Pelomyxa schiedti]